jgi:hypothetical protein
VCASCLLFAFLPQQQEREARRREREEQRKERQEQRRKEQEAAKRQRRAERKRGAKAGGGAGGKKKRKKKGEAGARDGQPAAKKAKADFAAETEKERFLRLTKNLSILLDDDDLNVPKICSTLVRKRRGGDGKWKGVTDDWRLTPH